MTAVASPVEVLNRLLTVVYRSYVRYLQDAQPWTKGTEDQIALRKLSYISADQEESANRLVRMVRSMGGTPEHGSYPMVYADWNDLSLTHTLKQAVTLQKRDIAIIEDCIYELRDHPRERAYAEEILGGARAYLETLEEMARGVR
jgi:hypothetical protein